MIEACAFIGWSFNHDRVSRYDPAAPVEIEFFSTGCAMLSQHGRNIARGPHGAVLTSDLAAPRLRVYLLEVERRRKIAA